MHWNLRNLVSVEDPKTTLIFLLHLCCDNNCSCHFDANQFSIQDIATRKVLYKVLSENGLYPIHTKNFIAQRLATKSKIPLETFLASKEQAILYSNRIGHPDQNVLKSALQWLSLNRSHCDQSIC